MLTEKIAYQCSFSEERAWVDIRRAAIVLKDGVPFGKPVYHRFVVFPGDDLEDQQLSPTERGSLPDDLMALIHGWWNEARVAEYNAVRAAAEASAAEVL